MNKTFAIAYTDDTTGEDIVRSVTRDTYMGVAHEMSRRGRGVAPLSHLIGRMENELKRLGVDIPRSKL